MRTSRRGLRTEAFILAVLGVLTLVACQVKNDRPIVVPRTEGHRAGYVEELREKLNETQGELDRVEAERFKLVQSAESSAMRRRDPKYLAQLRELETERLAKRAQLERIRNEIESESNRLRSAEKSVYLEYGKFFPYSKGTTYDFKDFRIRISDAGDRLEVLRHDGKKTEMTLDSLSSHSFASGRLPFRIEIRPGEIAVFSVE